MDENLTTNPNPIEERVRRSRTPASSPVLVINLYAWSTPLFAILALVGGILIGYYANRQSPSNPVAASTENAPERASLSPAEQKNLMVYLLKETKHFSGDENAPVTIIEFSDFQCPYCGRFFKVVNPDIDKNYVKTGKVRLGYWHFAFLGQESFWAAEASECAGDQNKFWEFHDLLFNSQSGENGGAFSKDNLKKLASNIKLDQTKFNECLDSGKYSDFVQKQTSSAKQLGVSSTPSFVVNGQPVIGAQPFSVFQEVIESQLKAAQSSSQ